MNITRRDFINGVLVGSGAALLAGKTAAGAAGRGERVGEDWYGYGGVGDYAPSHGNTPELVNTAHRLRDGGFAALPASMPIAEEYDVVIVGAGMAGLGAAWHFKKHARPGQTCLLLDNHPLFGGEAKENEFQVDGETLLAPQGANGFFLPARTDDPEAASGDPRYYAEFNIPRSLPYADWAPGAQPLNICRDNYGYLHWLLERDTDVGYFFADAGGGNWARNIWRDRLRKTPWSAARRRALLAWHDSRNETLAAGARDAWLDSMSYKTYLERELGLGPEGARAADLFLAGSFGLGSDSVSAWVAKDVLMPGVLSQAQFERGLPRRNSFPGGNSGFARYFLKHILPAAIEGGDNLDDIVTGRIDFAELDRPGSPIRVRLRSTAVEARHAAGKNGPVRVVYSRGGREYALRAKGVVMATGGWINRYTLRDLPDDFRQAYLRFHHAPFLVVNVALRQWRFLYELGITACRWQGGFGAACNIRQPMHVGRHKPPLHPDKPAVLTFYAPYHTPGLPPRAQTSKGRAELFYTTYADYEDRIRRQMTTLFAASGFDAARDIRGIILNRWGHAYVVPEPGFFYDTDQRIAPRNIIQRGYGRIAFGHSELEGFQHWGPAADQGRRAMQQVLSA